MPIKVVELFAGVGGFRIGLEGPPGSPRDKDFAVVWSNQWEPSTKKQHAAEIYVKRWGLTESKENPLHFIGEGEVFVNDDISTIEVEEIPDHDLLVGGFPCQDYSVAKTAKDASGIEGKKGVLWWEIQRILSGKKPSYALLENVDRLLKSPTKQRGRDFAVMLSSLSALGYIVEWRVINAADYGMPQRRRRVFIMAYAPGTPQHDALKNEENIKQWFETDGTFAKAFPIKPLNILFAMPNQIMGSKDNDLADVSLNFNKGANSKAKSPFKKSGIVVGNNYYTYDTIPNYDESRINLADVLLTPSKIPVEYVVNPDSVLKTKGWKYLKGAKDEARKGTDDFTYRYKEGPMVFPDALDRPSRTIITGEGGSTPSRFKHVVKFKPTKKMKEAFDLDTKECQGIRKEFGLTKSEWLRRLTPVELERLNMFPDNHTEGTTDGKRAFFMGNALVIGIIEALSKQITTGYDCGDLRCVSGHKFIFSKEKHRFTCVDPVCFKEPNTRQCPECGHETLTSDGKEFFCDSAFCYCSDDYDLCLENRIDALREGLELCDNGPWEITYDWVIEDYTEARKRNLVTPEEYYEAIGNVVRYCEVEHIRGLNNIITELISRHETKDARPVIIGDSTFLLPMVNHTGKMSVNAYTFSTKSGWKKCRRLTNANRLYCGILDFMIIDTRWPDCKMRHDEMMSGILRHLDQEIVMKIYDGIDPGELNLNEIQLQFATNLWLAFIEQELNWGVQNFQLHTHFGDTRFLWKESKWKGGEKCKMLENAVPRDYLCSHVLYLFDKYEDAAEEELEQIIQGWKDRYLGETKAGTTIQPFIDNASERFPPTKSQFLPSNLIRGVRRWIDPFLEEVEKVCLSVGPNHRWKNFYTMDDNDIITLMTYVKDDSGKKIRMQNGEFKLERLPHHDQGVDWPQIPIDGFQWISDDSE
jgi:DNA (cytosine-5)-methyltransferase 1